MLFLLLIVMLYLLYIIYHYYRYEIRNGDKSWVSNGESQEPRAKSEPKGEN